VDHKHERRGSEQADPVAVAFGATGTNIALENDDA
jgi:hypothetical protein